MVAQPRYALELLAAESANGQGSWRVVVALRRNDCIMRLKTVAGEVVVQLETLIAVTTQVQFVLQKVVLGVLILLVEHAAALVAVDLRQRQPLLGRISLGQGFAFFTRTQFTFLQHGWLLSSSRVVFSPKPRI